MLLACPIRRIPLSLSVWLAPSLQLYGYWASYIALKLVTRNIICLSQSKNVCVYICTYIGPAGRLAYLQTDWLTDYILMLCYGYIALNTAYSLPLYIPYTTAEQHLSLSRPMVFSRSLSLSFRRSLSLFLSGIVIGPLAPGCDASSNEDLRYIRDDFINLHCGPC